MTDSENRLVWIDMETTGLEPKLGVPLELGFIVTDLELNELARNAWTIFDEGWNDEGRYTSIDPYVSDMHKKSGLWTEMPDHGTALQSVQVQAAEWLLDDMGVGAGGQKLDPMCGSSVQFDREWLREWFPDVFDLFSYRNIDISTLKELMRRFSPEIYKLIDSEASKRGLHRVLPDLEDTISEFKFYREEFLYVPSDFEGQVVRANHE